ncbi:MAG: WD40 repeat domain-containing protein [Rhodospirillales bacterium]|nr:WD40 repeat domain-containing protein [Rhodospirillales bacterium]
MSAQVRDADHILETRGTRRDLGAHVVACTFAPDGMAAFGLGDGTLRIATDGDWTSIPAHEGAVLALAADAKGLVTGGDDGKLQRIADATVTTLADFGSRWVEHVAATPTHIAAGYGKRVALLDTAGKLLKTLEHPSSVTGLVFDAKGKRIGASHVNGASLWFVAAKTDNPRKLEWKGSHTGIVISPDGENVVTAMQENALHGWRLSDGQHMRMSGYPAKTKAMSFSRNGKWLATSGAESIVLWPFFGGGPMGKAPTELAGGDAALCTFVACHPQHEAVAAGFSDGMVVLADIGSERILPVAGPGGRGAITAMAWHPDGARLAFGTETGFAGVVDFSKQ